MTRAFSVVNCQRIPVWRAGGMLSRAAGEHVSERLGLAAGDTTTVASRIVYNAFGNVTSQTNPAVDQILVDDTFLSGPWEKMASDERAR